MTYVPTTTPKDNEALRDQVIELNDKLGLMHKQLQKKQLQAEEEVVKARQQAKKFKVERDRLRERNGHPQHRP